MEKRNSHKISVGKPDIWNFYNNYVFAGIILNYMLESIPQFLPERLASTTYHWFIGVIFSVTIYR